MSTAIRIGWVVVCILLAVLRVRGVMDNRFQAIAHLVVGGLLGAFALGKAVEARYSDYGRPLALRVNFYGWLGLAITLVEVYAFFAGIGKIDGR